MQQVEHHRVSIPYVGMDVHTANYTLCTTSIEKDKAFALTQVKPDHAGIVRTINRQKEPHGQDSPIVCRCEAPADRAVLFLLLCL